VSFVKVIRTITTARAVSSIAVWLGLSAGLSATPIIVGITADSQLVQINQATGVGSALVTLDGSYNPLGIASNGTSLFLYGQNNGDLRQVTSFTTGATSQLGTPLAGVPSTLGFVPTKGDLTYHAGNFYIGSSAAADGSFSANGSLFSVVNAPGYAASQLDTGAFPKVGGLAFSSGGVFYGVDQFGNTLYTLNAATGTATSSTALTGAGLDPTVDTVGGLIFGTNGTLYAAVSPDGINSEWFSINTATGAATDLGSIGGYDIVGLALVNIPVVNPIPEPASFVLIATGACALWLRRKRLNS